MTAEVAAVAAAHPDIVPRFSIGKSYQGRDIWAVKISDNVGVDEAEPEVMFDGGHHADEHMAAEMTLRILHWLVDGYGHDPRITNDRRLRARSGSSSWSTRTAPNTTSPAAGSTTGARTASRRPAPRSIGTDLNRNYGYRWGGGGRTSANPADITYRGPTAFSTPEARAMRDFLASRVVGGRQQIRAAITFHEYGRLVMWPYGYTMTNVPADMTAQDHAALATIGRTMAATNGYTPQQASDLYISSGTSRDYQYGVYRIFAYTFEMSVKDYPDDSRIASETGRNKEAVLYLMERAACPLGVLGAAVRTARCGAFDDDLEVFRGWTRNPDGTDTAPANARFTRRNPSSTSSSGPEAARDDAVGRQGVRHRRARPAHVRAPTTWTGGPRIRSPRDRPSGGRRPAADVRATSSPTARARPRPTACERSSSAPTAARSRSSRSSGARSMSTARGGPPRVSLDAFAGKTIRLRFVAADGGPGNLLEVELDDIRVTQPS